MKKIMTLIVVAMTAVASYADFVYKAELTVTGYSGTTTLQNFPVLVRLSPANISGFSYSLCQADGKDIQFTSPDGETVYPHEIDTWNPDGESLIWVNVAELSGTETKIMFWFGNAEITEMPPSRDAWCSANGSGHYGAVWHLAETIDADSAPTALSADSAQYASDRDMNGVPIKSSAGDLSAMVSVVGVVGNGRMNSPVDKAATSNGVCLDAPPCYGDKIDTLNALTVSGWYTLTSKGHNYIFMQEYNSFSVQKGSGGATVKNDIVVNCGQNPAATDAVTFAGVLPEENQWFHLAVTFLGTAVNVFINGECVGIGTTGKALHTPYATTKTRGLGVTIGSGRGAGHYPLAGSYDEVRVLSNVASADWVKAEYETATKGDYVTYGAAKKAAANDSLVITAAPAELGGDALSPTYGTVKEFPSTLPLTASDSDVAVSNNLKIAFVGWELYRLDDAGSWNLVDHGDGTSYDYVHQEGTNDRFVWKYVNKRALTLAVAPASSGAFEVQGETAQPGTIWLPEQATVSVRAIPATGYDFLYWGDEYEGDTTQPLVVPFASEDGASLLAKFLSNGEGHEPVTVGSSGASGSWNDPAVWDGGVVPQAKDTVLITNGAIVVNEALPRFAKFVISNATLTASNWLTRVRSDEIIIGKGGLVRTVGGIFDGEERNRVWMSGVTLTVEEGGRISADDAGYACNSGPAWADVNARQTAIARDACGTHGGEYAGQPVANPPSSYGSEEEPEDLGSGCGELANSVRRDVGVGGGAVRLDFTGDVIIDGTVSASVSERSTRNAIGMRGAGGSVWISCRTISGSGAISADGGNPVFSGSWYCGGGGRIAVHYDTTVQDAGGCGVTFSARGGVASDQLGSTVIEPGVTLKHVGYARSAEDQAFTASAGTLWFSDNRFLTSKTYAAKGLPFSGRWVSPVPLASLEFDGGLSISNVMVQLPTGVDVTVNGDLDVGGSGCFARRNCGIVFNSSRVCVKGDVRVSGARIEVIGGSLKVEGDVIESSIELPAASRFRGGELAIKALGAPAENGSGAELEVLGTLRIPDQCVVCPFADPETGSFVKMRAGRVVLAEGGRIDADEKGWLMKTGSGAPANNRSGASYGGAGGSNQATPVIPPTYGTAKKPYELGSGGASTHTYAGFDGGGIVDLEVSGTFELNGIVSADGNTHLTAIYAGGSSGGSVVIHAGRLTGTTGLVRAQGGCATSDSTHAAYGSTGGGGRVAVYADSNEWPASMRSDNVIVAPGCKNGDPTMTFGAEAGSVYWSVWHKGLVISIR